LSSKVYTDFDGTLIRKNAAAQLVKHYVLHGKDPWYERLLLIRFLLFPSLRRKYLTKYYEIVRRIPQTERHAILSKLQINPYWQIVSRELTKKGKIALVILSRNTLTVIDEWLEIHSADLKKLNVEVEQIIANNPISEEAVSTVIERKKRYKHVAIGQMFEEEKPEFLSRNVVYIGDAEDEGLRPYVKTFIKL